MSRYYYDLHVHSCLSPCADNDMTVNNIAGMAALNGLQIVALTDHNSCANCPAFYTAAKRQGIIPVAGMELTTSEEIHMVCLFEQLNDAMAFHEAVVPYRMQIPNRTDIFGDQLLLDENDEEIGTEPFLLPPATMLSLEDGYRLVAEHHGVCWPAHVDRTANGILGILGEFPASPAFGQVEYADKAKQAESERQHPILATKQVIYSSDAHHLWEIAEAEHAFMLDDDPYSGDFVRHQLFRLLTGKD